MKKFNLFVVAILMVAFTANAQLQEIGPYNEAPPANENTSALFDLLYQYDVGSLGNIGVDGLAGVVFFDNHYWVSEWASDIIHVLNFDGSFSESFSIPGVTGTRSFTTDGTSIFIGGGSTSIYEIDPVSRTLISTLTVITGTDAEARMCTYDPTLDGGNGGFWIGDFGSDIISISMIGFELSVIPSAVHNTVIYGGAIDNVSPGGPFLWIFDQSGAAPNQAWIRQLDPATGIPTGVVYDYTADGGLLGATDVLAGGLFISEDATAGYVTMVGLCQCSPSNQLFGLELVESLGTNDNEISGFSIYPNPANSNVVSINTSIQGKMQVSVFDVLGKEIINTEISNNELNISTLDSGIYMVRVNQNGITATKKLIKN